MANSLLANFDDQIKTLQDAGHQFWTRGWSLGTSSNYSVVVNREPLQILVTASGKDKGHLSDDDFVIVGADGDPIEPQQPKSSAETLLHCSIATHQHAGAIMHTHSVWATLLSNHFFEHKGFFVEGFEFLKGLTGIDTHNTKVWIPIFDNTQDIPFLAEQVEEYWRDYPDQPHHAYLIRKHGLYTWADNLPGSIRQIEVLEFLFECIGRTTKLV